MPRPPRSLAAPIARAPPRLAAPIALVSHGGVIPPPPGAAPIAPIPGAPGGAEGSTDGAHAPGGMRVAATTVTSGAGTRRRRSPPHRHAASRTRAITPIPITVGTSHDRTVGKF